MVKKAKKASLGPSPLSSSHPLGEEAKMRLKHQSLLQDYTSPLYSSHPLGEEAKMSFKHQSLLQDYKDLVKETGSKKKKLLKANQMKLKLLAEVKFLRRKLESFIEIPHRLKKRSNKITSPSIRFAKKGDPIFQSKSHLEDMICKGTETAIPSTISLLDLNQASIPDVEELEEQEPLRPDRLKRLSMDGATMATDLKLSLFKDVSNENQEVEDPRRQHVWSKENMRERRDDRE